MNENDVEREAQYQRTVSLLLCIRSIHWAILIWKKSNMPKDMIELYEMGEKSLLESAKELPYYAEASGNRGSDAVIDSLHRIEADLEEYFDSADDELHIPASTLVMTIELYGLAINKLEKSGFAFDKAYFYRATQKMISLIKSLSSGVSEMDRLGRTIDSFLLEDGASGAD